MSEETTSTATETTAETAAETETATTLVTSEAAETTEATTTETTAETTEAATSTEETAETETSEEVVGAPEEYGEFTMPEGIELDAELTTEFKTVAKELNLTQEQAQRVVELGAQMRQRDAEAIISLREDWVTQTTSDPEIGGDKLDATLATAKRAIAAHGSAKFIEILNATGFGNHPEFVRFCANAGRSVSEDTKVVTGAQSQSTQRTLANRLYDKE